MRKGSAGSGRGIVRFINELVAVVARAGATGPLTVRADSGFWSWKLIDRLNTNGIAWSVTVTRQKRATEAIAVIPEGAWVDIDYTIGGQAQVAETTYTTGTRDTTRPVRLVVRRTRLTEPAPQKLWPDWRHRAFITNTTLDTVAADEFHRGHATVELTIRDLKDSGLEHVPSGHF